MTIPQVYVSGEFVGGCDILIGSKRSDSCFVVLGGIFSDSLLVHQSGELEALLAKNKIITPENPEASESTTSS